jgi:hypothetical protein
VRKGKLSGVPQGVRELRLHRAEEVIAKYVIGIEYSDLRFSGAGVQYHKLPEVWKYTELYVRESGLEGAEVK